MQRILFLGFILLFVNYAFVQDSNLSSDFSVKRKILESRGENYIHLEKQIVQSGSFPTVLLLVKSNTSCEFRYYKYIDLSRQDQILNRIKSVFPEINHISLKEDSIMYVEFVSDFSEARFLEFLKLMGYEGYETK